MLMDIRILPLGTCPARLGIRFSTYEIGIACIDPSSAVANCTYACMEERQ